MPLNVDKIVVRIDGWHEIGAINVDSVGTYFRLTRLNETNRNVSGLVSKKSGRFFYFKLF